MIKKFSGLRREFLAAAVIATFVAPPLVVAQSTKVLKLGGLLTVTGPNASLGKVAHCLRCTHTRHHSNQFTPISAHELNDPLSLSATSCIAFFQRLAAVLRSQAKRLPI